MSTKNRSDEGLTLATSAFLPITVANSVVNTKLPAEYNKD